MAETAPQPLVCAGRAATTDGRTDPDSTPCGRTYTGPEAVNDGTDHPRDATAADWAERARAAGWSVPPAPAGPMCPSCRKPSPELSRPARDLMTPAPAGHPTHEGAQPA